MWFDRDYRWVLPMLCGVMLAMIIVFNWPRAGTWYDQQDRVRVSLLKVTELAGWIIEGRNDFIPVLLQSPAEPGIDNIPGLVVLDPSGDLAGAVSKFPVYKQLVAIPPDASLQPAVAAALVQNEKRRVILLAGGAAAWRAMISSEQLDEHGLADSELKALRNVRPFFHPELQETSSAGAASQQHYVAPQAEPPPMLEDVEEEEEEEGC